MEILLIIFGVKFQLFFKIFNSNNRSILLSLILNIEKNMNFVKQTQIILIIYKIYYKVMTT